jgi:phospholipid transport system transporter-binding protein
MITGKATLTTDADTLAITGVLDFDTVVSLQAEGQQWIETAAPNPFTVELSAVQYSTSAGLALLLDWLRVAARSGKTARLQGMPADMQALVGVGGLEQVLPQH